MRQMWRQYHQPGSLDETLGLLHRYQAKARVVAGGTDLVVELSRGFRPTETLIDITRLAGLRYVRADHETLYLGGLTTHNDIVASPECVANALPLAQACWDVGAPQLRARATVAGNVVTASPANDTISALTALDATLVLVSAAGQREVAIGDFFLGVRRTVLRPDELIREIRVPALRENQRGLFLKLGLRRAQAISVIHLAMVLTFDGEVVRDARIALGCLAPTIVRAPSAEAAVIGKRLAPDVCAEAGRAACTDVSPISDIRGSKDYRLATLKNLVAHGLERTARGEERAGWPERPVLLETGRQGIVASGGVPFAGVIATTINGQPRSLPDAADKTLLNALREDAGLTGAKEGCAEGECGACTVWLNGQAVMACLVPAPQAHNAEVVTIEGLAATAGTSGQNGALHPLQHAFIERGAVQCGFCIPGMVMAGAKLLEECPAPDLTEIQVGLSGNLCRCTGYRKILDAVQRASAGTPPTGDLVLSGEV
ncbi:MAG: FAD binding domain-containing protein [Chloroflexia bacterium]|nr:FAD binding domain-containing protein [Chloroflexia bacterium]